MFKEVNYKTKVGHGKLLRTIWINFYFRRVSILHRPRAWKCIHHCSQFWQGNCRNEWCRHWWVRLPVQLSDFLVFITLKFPGGILGHIELGRHARYGYDQRVEVFGSLGQAVSNNQRISAYEVWDANGKFFTLKRLKANQVPQTM